MNTRPPPPNDSPVPLSAVETGATAVVHMIHGGRGLAARLAELGIWPQVTLKVIRGGRRGPVVAEVKGGQIIIGQGMAERILVVPLAPGPRNRS